MFKIPNWFSRGLVRLRRSFRSAKEEIDNRMIRCSASPRILAGSGRTPTPQRPRRWRSPVPLPSRFCLGGNP